MRNRYPGTCDRCREHVEADAGVAVQEDGRWRVRCLNCSSAPKVEARIFGSKLRLRPMERLGEERFAIYQGCTGEAGGTYNATEKANDVPLERGAAALALLKQRGFSVDVLPADVARLQAECARTLSDEDAADATARAIDATMRASGTGALFPFQLIGAKWLAGTRGALLADDMGLGKTVQALAAMPRDARVVIVCPKVARGVWKREIGRWRNDLSFTAVDKKSCRWPAVPGECVAVTFQSFFPPVCVMPDQGVEMMNPPDGMILIADEAQYVRNRESAMTKRFFAAAKAVLENGGRVWLLTATPMDNMPWEIWTILGHVNAQRVVFPGGFVEFARLFGGVKGDYGWEFNSAARDGAEIARRLRRVMLRRMKDDVLKELPAKTYQAIPVDLDAATKRLCADLWERRPEWEEALDRVRSGGGDLAFEGLSRVREALGKLKLAAALEWIEGYEDAAEPVVVFCASKDAADTIGARDGWGKITGDTPDEERGRLQDAFQRGELKGMVGTIRAMGVSMTLTRSCTVAFCGLDWNPGWNRQAEDRVRRIGQHRPVTVVTFVADHALDERMTLILQEKESMVRDTTDAARLGANDAPASASETMRGALDALRGVTGPAGGEIDGAGLIAQLRELCTVPRINKIDRLYCEKLIQEGAAGMTELQVRSARRLLARYGVKA